MITADKIPYTREVRRKGKFVIQMQVDTLVKLTLKQKLKRWIKLDFKKQTRKRNIFTQVNADRTQYKLVSDIKQATAFSFTDACDTARSIADPELQVARVVMFNKQLITI